MSKTIYCRWSQSLGELESGRTAEEVWGTPPYNWRKYRNEPCVFMGLYDLRDYLALWRHRGKAWIFWCGSDIRNLRAGFIFNDGKLHWLSKIFGRQEIRNFIVDRILYKAEHWVENEAEAWQLKNIGVQVAGICPSFIGDVKRFKISFQSGNKVWASCSKGREKEYGWDWIIFISGFLPEIEFHLYGSDWPEFQEKLAIQHISLKEYAPNVILHGRIPKEKMNRQIKKMQCGLRLNKHDGFSEVSAKSVLWGQYPITYLYHPYITQFTADNIGFPATPANLVNLVKLLKQIPKKKKPNLKARKWYVENLNAFPWNRRKNV